MSVEVLPLGFKCNIACPYCYQETPRVMGAGAPPPYDLEKMKAALRQEGGKFTVFGGEPLLVPLEDLKALWQFGMDEFKSKVKPGERVNSVQTNGTLITQEHIKAFKEYDVGVGMSVDGPGALNDARWAGDLQRTREATTKSLWALYTLLIQQQNPAIIVTLTQHNASAERLPKLLDWFRELSRKGLRHVNLHLLEIEHESLRASLELSEDETVNALISCAQLQNELPMKFAPLTDMLALLRSRPEEANCVWNGCDPYTTAAVHGVDGEGNRRNCGRTLKEGVNWVKADVPGYERYVALALTPQEYGGCQGCRFFFACKGQCPGTAEEGDWRGRTEHCGVLIRVFTYLEGVLEANGEVPASKVPGQAERVGQMIAAWTSGRSRPSAGHGDGPHGDHTDVVKPVQTHGDHTDKGLQW